MTLGSAYAVSGVGLVLTYRTSGLFNFAHGALATAAAYLFYFLHVQQGWSWQLSAVVCVLIAAPLLGLALELVARRLEGQSLVMRVTATIGILLMVQAIAVIIWGHEVRYVPKFLPTDPIHVGGAVVTTDQVIVIGTGLVATTVLYLFLRYARMGLAMRAVVQDPSLLDIAGMRPTVVRRTAWVIGSVFASVSGLLIVPFIALDATTLTFLVIASFGAAAIGQFRSLPGTYAGALVIGVAAAFATKWFTTGLSAGLSAALPFLILFLVLLVSPRRHLADAAPLLPRAAAAWKGPWQVQVGFGAVLLVVLLFVPQFAGLHLTDWSRTLAMVIVFLSLGLLVRTSGQVSLCHVSFMAIGACTLSRLMVVHGWPWLAAVLVAGLIAVPIGALLAIPAMRLSGLYLALATFGFGLMLQYIMYGSGYMFGKMGVGVHVPRPDFAAVGLPDTDTTYYYFVLLLAVLTLLLVLAIVGGRLGRLLRALADSSVGLSASGTSIHLTRLLVFCISAFLAAIGGVLEAGGLGIATETAYMPLMSLTLFCLIIINLGNAPWYALGAAMGSTLIPSYWSDASATAWLQLGFGLGALGYTLKRVQDAGDTPESLRRFLDGIFRKPKTSVRRTTTAVAAPVLQAEPATFELNDLRVQFGGLAAVDGVSLTARTGVITGLIGPNGAGKTTIFNVASGFLRPSRGRVFFQHKDVTRFGVARRARNGIGRTFQRMELFDSLTVRENVALGYEARFAGTRILSHLLGSRAVREKALASADAALAMCHIENLAELTPGGLSTGQRRLVELARCLAGPFKILLLDEPSSGLDRAETAQFGEILQRVVAERGVGILLVEHDIALVSEICEYIYVIDFGKLIYQGDAADVIGSPIVRAAYLGDELETASATEKVAESASATETV
ncbi:branched-chain amino acid ABC transporter permease/ATP-binding protein [Dactylosporangium fulvum]|uniref:Branched-chain amino acid ABC transporter permease/ATP-binding protein n=1 Tax=Dactylosporangium fulvum TaxID=53359 RepID=A0ABY5VX65_9ACTN|nr:branched-chain amino acid ABC transporter permease/ATP-binding protein [Dactylosporangium fulvum]UWP80381.1 branched-chain amino acid ABC transporter permease/ATP-binding protein [Dactylosporangium fulvum]